MKFMKYALLTLLIAVATDIAIVFAYPDIYATVLVRELDKNNEQFTDYFTKHTWTTQTYENLSTYTWLTSPCETCKIGTRPYTEDGDYGVSIFTTLGQKKSMGDPTSFMEPNNYRLLIWRSDSTLLTTNHSAQWIMNA